jgi:hypothetical protein
MIPLTAIFCGFFIGVIIALQYIHTNCNRMPTQKDENEKNNALNARAAKEMLEINKLPSKLNRMALDRANERTEGRHD